MRQRKNSFDTDYKIALAGNPNVGKSTIFNALTGLNQHTGNWTGKTVELSTGEFIDDNVRVKITDLPGTYSMVSFSNEETVTRDYLTQNQLDCVVIAVDTSAIERNLCFALEVLSLQKNAVLCLNMCDEAEKNGIMIDTDELSLNLGIPVVRTCATKKRGLSELKSKIIDVCSGKTECFRVSRLYEEINVTGCENHVKTSQLLSLRSKEICKRCALKDSDEAKNKRFGRLDKILTSKALGIPIMLLLFALLFWITAVGANYPSEWLSMLFAAIKSVLYQLFELLQIPEWITGLLIDGVYTTLSWVVAVMLPPMAIFFPLFSLIEDSGYLPRIAFNLDKFFAKCGAHGKQSLTMAMGIGCNACGVTGCRIIESPQERLIATLTNNIMPCNGRFPILIAVIMMFFAGSFGVKSGIEVAVILVFIIVICVLITLAVSKLLSVTVAKGVPSGFALELPPYRKPQIIKTVVRSLLDRTLFVLDRAVIVAAPAGAVIWLLANVYVGDMSLLAHCTSFFEPFGKAIGLDGVIVMAFILGFPANETVIPIIIMSYLSTGTMVDYSGYSELLEVFSANGWTLTTAICMMIMTVLHFPCSTTCLTIKKETGSFKWTALSMILPTVLGIALCAIVNLVSRF